MATLETPARPSPVPPSSYDVPPLPDARRLRALLAEAEITHSALARACGLNRMTVGRMLHGGHVGELARLRMWRGLAHFGLDAEVRDER